jgi:potassium efflux system protein
MMSPAPSTRTGAVLRVVPMLLALALPGALAAQGQTPGPAAQEVAPVDAALADLEQLRATVEGDGSLSEDARVRILETLTLAIGERRRAGELAVEGAAIAERVAAAPERIAALKEQLDRPVPEQGPVVDTALPLEKLVALARDKQQALESGREALKERERGLASIAALGPTLSDEIAATRRTLRDLRNEPDVSPPGEPPAATSARRAYRAAREARLAAVIANSELQLANYEPLLRLATLERDVAAIQVPRLDAEREQLVQAVDARRAEQARAARDDALLTEALAASLPEPVAALAADNATLREELQKITADTQAVSERLRASERRASELDADMAAIRERVAAVGPTEAIGRLLRRRLQALHRLQVDRLRVFGRTNEIVRATDRRIDLGEQRRDLAVTQTHVDQVLASVTEEQRAAFGEAPLRARAAELVAAKRATVEELQEAYGRYLTQLTSFDAVERQLVVTTEAMREFIRRELLWIRGLQPVRVSDFAGTAVALAPLLDVANWERALEDARAAVAQQPGRAAVGALIVVLLLAARPAARRRLAAVGQLTARIRTDAFRHTVVALALTMVIAAAWPAVYLFISWLLGAADTAAPFSEQLSVTLSRLARYFAIFSTARWLMHRDGLARRHFNWPEPVRQTLRRELRWLLIIGVGCILPAVFGIAQGTTAAQLALGRPGLIVFSLALTVFFWRVFQRHGALMETVWRKHPEGLAGRSWRLWFSALVGIPVVIVVAAIAGYYDGARTAMILIIDSGWLLLGVWVLRDTMLRWFTVSERRLRFERALRQREEARAERERQQAEGETEPSATEAYEVEIPEVDYRELGEQGRAVVQAAMGAGVVLALWVIWSDLLPALTVLDRIQLPTSRLAIVNGVQQRVPVTVTDVLVALLVLGATLFAARNLSGILGFTVLRHVARDAGVQYAIVTLCQYVLIGAGLLYVFGAMGVEWSKLQWLVAALGVGLGFGLQEIVANFVSGIILLLERPVRVGDIITVGEATGRVARIRIRATTLIDWDRKELVVPNKEFVTGRLLNWTLSNDVLRLVIPVGIAYGSDPRRARELLLKVAEADEHVLEDPAPVVVFDNFGDNALVLELRVYLPSIEHLLVTKTELHVAIYERFAREGIVIAFPQRDVHLDTAGPLDVRVQGAEDKAPPAWRRWRRGRG